MWMWRRRRMDRNAAELAGVIAFAGLLDVTAGTGLAYLAGFGEFWSVLRRPDWPWLAGMAGALAVSYAGYLFAYRGIYRAEGGYKLPRKWLRAVVTAGYGGLFAHRGTSPDDLVLRHAGASKRESVVRAGALGGVEQGTLALGGCVASIYALSLGQSQPPLGATLPWAVVPVPAATIVWWASARYGRRLRGRGGWRDRVSVLADSVLLAARIMSRPERYGLALAGMVVFWGAEMVAAWAGLTAFGFAMNGAALIVGFATGMVLTRRIAPLAGAGVLTLVLPLTIWYCGAPLAVAVAGIFAYRALTLWLPIPFALYRLPVLRQLSKEALPSGQARQFDE